MKRFFVLLITAALAGIGVYGVFYLGPREVVKGPSAVEAAGVIEVKEYELAPEVSGRIVWLCCDEGDEVKKGDVAVRLDNSELSAMVEQGRAALEAAGAAVKAAEAGLESARARVEGAAAELDAAESRIKRLRVLAEDAKKDLARAGALLRDGFVTRQDYDRAKTKYETYLAELESTKAERVSRQAGLRLARIDVKAAGARLERAKAEKKEAEANLKTLLSRLDDTEIKVPDDGVVAHRAFERGETINPGEAVYTIYDPKDVWARVDIEETEAGMVKLGAPADVAVAALPGRVFKARVKEVGREGEFATQRDVLRGRSDIRTFRVKLSIKEPAGLLKPGMSVRVKIYSTTGRGGG